MAVDSMVRHCISLTVEGKYAIHDRLGMVVGMCMGVFCEDEFLIGSRYPKWLQGAINFLIGIFGRVRLMAKIEKSNTMTCQMRDICTEMLEKDFSCWSTGEGGTYLEHLQL